MKYFDLKTWFPESATFWLTQLNSFCLSNIVCHLHVLKPKDEASRPNYDASQPPRTVYQHGVIFMPSLAGRAPFMNHAWHLAWGDFSTWICTISYAGLINEAVEWWGCRLQASERPPFTFLWRDRSRGLGLIQSTGVLFSGDTAERYLPWHRRSLKLWISINVTNPHAYLWGSAQSRLSMKPAWEAEERRSSFWTDASSCCTSLRPCVVSEAS